MDIVGAELLEIEQLLENLERYRVRSHDISMIPTDIISLKFEKCHPSRRTKQTSVALFIIVGSNRAIKELLCAVFRRIALGIAQFALPV